MNMKGVWKRRYPNLHGRDWVNQLDKDDHQCLVELLCNASQWGKIGGKARAFTAIRDANGRFAKGKADPIVKILGRAVVDEFEKYTPDPDDLDLAYAVDTDPENTISHPTAQSEYEFFSRYAKQS